MTPDLIQHRVRQAERLARFGATASLDMHCHCLPGLDDGPATTAEAIELCRALVDDGITAVLATPHQLGPFEAITANAIRAAVAALNAELIRHAIPLDVRPGAEIRIDERLPDGIDAGTLLTLGDRGVHVLIELPHSTLLDLRPLTDRLVAGGLTPILAHPERHAALIRDPSLVLPWLERGMLLQVTACSLLGGFGPLALGAAWRMVEAGWVSLIATDAHDTTARGPTMRDAIDAVAARLGHAVARRLCLTHPQCVADGNPVPRPMVRRLARGGW